jgi:prepilin-type N-terminal cleavage/methylation domain-containing protein
MARHTTTTHTTTRGFSLIEVLMAVLILSLGLLGLGAIMPAVVKQQRVGADQTFGTLAARSVGATIKGNALLNTVNPTKATANITLRNYNRWEGWARCLPRLGYTYGIPEDGSWMVMTVDANPNGSGTARAIVGPTAGTGAGNVIGPVDDAFINLQDRLVPSVASVNAGAGVTSEPQFVVDLAVRRMKGFEPNQFTGNVLQYERPGNFTVQVALMARRVDQRIRPPAGVSIMQAITDVGGTQANRRWPISEDSKGDPLGGGETSGPNTPRYSLPYTVNVTFDPNTPDQLVVESVDNSALPTGGTVRTNQLAFQQMIAGGQMIVDNLGTIYNVQGSDDRANGGALALRISPPVAGNVQATGFGSLRQVLVCPQPPASINIITVNP